MLEGRIQNLDTLRGCADLLHSLALYRLELAETGYYAHRRNCPIERYQRAQQPGNRIMHEFQN